MNFFIRFSYFTNYLLLDCLVFSKIVYQRVMLDLFDKFLQFFVILD